MEQKRDQQNPERSRPTIRTFVFYNPANNTFIGRTAAALKCQYLAIKVGPSTHIEGVNVPVPRATVVMVSGPCAIKIIDREVNTFFMISENGIEARQGRWPNYKFESVETANRFCKMIIGGETVEETVRVAKPSCTTPPYVEEEMVETGESLSLPGISFLNLESDEVPEKREQLRVEREKKKEVFGKVLGEMGATRGMGRIFGLGYEATSRLQTVKRITTRVQGKIEEKPKPQRVVEEKVKTQRLSRSPFSPPLKCEPESDDPVKVAEMIRSKMLQEQKAEMVYEVEEKSEVSAIPVAAIPDVNTMLERMRSTTAESHSEFVPIVKTPTQTTETLAHLRTPKHQEASPLLMHSPVSSFKLTDEYLQLAGIIHAEVTGSEIAVGELTMPLKLGAFEKIVTTYNFQRMGPLPIFNVNMTTCEYTFAGFEIVSKAMIALSGGCVVILPVF
ncbi:NS2 [CHeRI orbivirus 1]|nr:NS2 [CHeRI orbivirus 1]